jgi:hypothetical protein
MILLFIKIVVLFPGNSSMHKAIIMRCFGGTYWKINQWAYMLIRLS